ncbi:MAG TPA: alpha/beta hydrolase [Thermosynechococcus sp. M3746_W2019_013]|uniref:alpha/beta hydrolase n=1 Tax=Thermosynechococcus sp. M3746_W2019_013 TaxID=2747806 RepID=UPI001A00BE49|nr:alpha/beta hydrolase [Thermosynechococcus sp. M3746_W2019_013]HIK22323.1 alpha/beta hydrolase [Thermosynechococcus sp. M3746_W2019_013]
MNNLSLKWFLLPPLTVVVGLSLFWVRSGGVSATAAERIIFRYGPFERSLPIADLEYFATTGQASPKLISYLRLLPPVHRQQLRLALQERLRLSPVAVAQLLYSPLGQEFMVQAGRILQTQSRQENALALRAALILAATDPHGLTVLSVMRHYPSPSIRFDLKEGLAILKNFQHTIHKTEIILNVVRQQAIANQTEAIPASVQSLLQPGPWRWLEMPWTAVDESPQRLQLTGHSRPIAADLYLPIVPVRQRVPVVIVSHGLGATRYSYRYLCQHLASHGFAVIALEHVGSSARQVMSFPMAYVSPRMAAQEFLDRPLDVTFVLNRLAAFPEQLYPWAGQLNLERVAVIGQSFGGYTALALAGARLDFQQLRRHCTRTVLHSFNVSLLLQCQAQALPPKVYALEDARVQAVIAVNPITSALFSPESLGHLKAAVMLVAASNDTIAPPVEEQIYPFTWLTGRDRYLVLMDNATHFSTIGETSPNEPVLPVPKVLVGATPLRSRAYLRGLSLAFLRLHLLGDEQARQWLTPAAAMALSSPTHGLNLTQSLAPELLEKVPQAVK